MKIASLTVKNYRTLEDISLRFPASYTAICGANDSGKTNVVRVIRALMKEDQSLPFVFAGFEQEVSPQEDFPKWKSTDPHARDIEFEIVLVIDRERDTGLHSVIGKQLELTAPPDTLELHLKATYRADRGGPVVAVRVCGYEYWDIQAQELLETLTS